jgi:DNA-binding GntR family transcriptional regulator
VQAIRSGIKEGIYAPGQRLIESELTRTFGVSRGPLREAMWRLAGEGLVRIEPNRGVTVRKLSRAEVRHIYEIREMLEGLAARLAADQIDSGDHRSRLRSAQRTLDQCRKTNDVNGYILANEQLHELIVELSENELLSSLLGQLRVPIFRLQFRRFLAIPSAISASAEQHAEVLNAILAGESGAAERAMRRHIRESGQLIQDLPDSGFG